MIDVTVFGVVTSTPKKKYTKGEVEYSVINIASKDDYNFDVKKTTFIDVVAFGSLASICNEHLKKGDRVFVKGSIRVSDYQSHLYRYKKYSVVANRMVLITNRNEERELTIDQNSIDSYLPISEDENGTT